MSLALSLRLRAAAALVLPGAPVADVACDHARLAAWLVRSGTAPYAIASDLREGPLQGARSLLRRAGVEGVELRRANGLAKLRAGEVDVIVVAGVGGALAVRMLEAHPRTAASVSRIVLQPNTDWVEVRGFLERQRWAVEDETLCFEAGRAYWTVAITPRPVPTSWADADRVLGPVLRRRAGPLFLRWVEQRRTHLGALSDRLCATLGPTHDRVRSVDAERARFERALAATTINSGEKNVDPPKVDPPSDSRAGKMSYSGHRSSE